MGAEAESWWRRRKGSVRCVGWIMGRGAPNVGGVKEEEGGGAQL